MCQSLDGVLGRAFACLAEGAAEADSAWHVPTLANVDAAGCAHQRSVVLRGWHADARRLEIHTDTRSAKYADFRRDKRASLHGWDTSRRVQLRLRGAIGLHVCDAVAEAAWEKLRPTSRATYGILPGPGREIPAPSATTQAQENAGFAVFCVLLLTIEDLEWLHLEQGSYARARFRWDSGQLTSMWLVP